MRAPGAMVSAVCLSVLAGLSEWSPGEPARTQALSIAEQFGKGALLPFQLGKDKLVFSPPGAEAMITYGLAGRTAVMLGEPIGPPGAAREVLADFLARCATKHLEPVAYQVSPQGQDMFSQAGFRLFRVGQEAIVRLRGFDLRGPQHARLRNLRQTVGHCHRAGISTQWFREGIDVERQAEMWAQMAAVDKEWRAARLSPELGFTIGRLDRAGIAHQPACVAFDSEGKVAGFTTYLPTGTDRGWVVDLMRHARTCPPGVVECTIVAAAAALSTEGATALSLGLAPLAGLDNPRSIEEALLRLAGRSVGRLYNVRGLAFFKAKFDSVWVARYGAIRRRSELPAYALALLRLHLRRRSGPSWELPSPRG